MDLLNGKNYKEWSYSGRMAIGGKDRGGGSSKDGDGSPSGIYGCSVLIVGELIIPEKYVGI